MKNSIRLLGVIAFAVFFSCENFVELDDKKPGSGTTLEDDIIINDDTSNELDECIAHEWSALKVTKDATETEDGEATRTCTTSGVTENITLYATGTEGLNYEFINNGTAYRVNNGMNGAGGSLAMFPTLHIPAYHFNDKTGEYLPVIEIGTSQNSSANNAFGGINASNGKNDILTTVTFAENRQPSTISSFAFQHCTTLTSITIPASVTISGGAVFQGCISLENITISSDIISNAFTGCKALTEVTFTESVTTIGQGAFQNCTGLTEVTIPSSVTIIGTNAFYGCSNLTTVTLNEGLEFINSYAFAGCSKITGIIIPASVTSIGNEALTSINGSITVDPNNPNYKYYDEILYNMAEGKIVKVPSSINGHITIPEGITTIVEAVGYGSFKDRKGLTSITIPASVTTIGMQAFSGCTGLTSVDIPASVTTIGPYAFQGSGLVSVTVPGSVTSIKYYAFKDCKSLNSIIIPENTTVENNSFENCSSLESVTISKGVKFPYDAEYYLSEAFKNCTKLTNVIIEEGFTSGLGWGMFPGCSSLKSVTIPASVTTLSMAFYTCTGLESVTIPEGVTSIENYEFYGCTNLTSITIPASVQSIGQQAFQNCKSLTSITIPAGITSIGASVFSGCTSLTSVTIPASVTTIGASAFSACTGLTSVTFNGNSTAVSNVNSFPSSLKTFYDQQSEKSGTYVLNGTTWSKQ